MTQGGCAVLTCTPCCLLPQLAELQRADQLMNRLTRVAAAINLRTADPLTESGHDPVVELRHYYGTVASELTVDWQVTFSAAAGRFHSPCNA
jgi:hypothetical protein